MARRLLFKSGSKIQSPENKFQVFAQILVLPNIPTYENNAAAVADGYPVNGVYKTSTGELRIVV